VAGNTREVLGEMLTMLGYQVTASASAEETVRVPVEPAFDVLLTDFMLPGANGGELARSLRGRWPKLAVIVMSGYTDDEAMRRGVSEGKVRFLQKPFDMSSVAREIRAALSHPN
jgi:FixJ family two-component response regulator